jgi:hypothetical protein
MNGILGQLPPGLAGWVAADQMNRQKQAGKMQELQGILGMQGALAQQQQAAQMAPLQLEAARMKIDAMRNPGPKWEVKEIFDKDGRKQKVAINLLDPSSPPIPIGGSEAVRMEVSPAGEAYNPYGLKPGQRIDVTTPHQTWQQNTQFPTQVGIDLARLNQPVLSEAAGGWVPRPQVSLPGFGGVPMAPRAPQGQMPSAMDATPRISPNMMVSPQDQARRDQEAARIRTAEGNGGAGMVQTSAVVPGFTPVPGLAPKDKKTSGQNAVDQAFAKEYVEFKAAGGYADIDKNIRQLKQASELLGKDNSLTGPIRGMYPDFVRSITNPQAVATKEQVQEVAQRNLRLILGAQFTEKEGDRLISRVYNDRLSTEENKKRVDNLIAQISAAAQAKQSAAEYFEKNGTLTGWGGRLPKFEDFLPKDRQSDMASDILNQADKIVGGR